MDNQMKILNDEYYDGSKVFVSLAKVFGLSVDLVRVGFKFYTFVLLCSISKKILQTISK
jgi:hypothetical protein